MNAQEQHDWLIQYGYTEARLAENEWKPRPWTWWDNVKFDLQLHITLWFGNIRDRLRCPKCGAVGTYKPRYQPLNKWPRYYVCKWCGYGRTFMGEWKFWPDKVQHVWGQKSVNSGRTPKEIMEAEQVDPWVG